MDVSWSNRKKIKPVRIENADRLLVTPQAGELILVCDALGIPTGVAYIGDGSTAGGIGPLAIVSAIDHNSLLNLPVGDPHTQYVLADGTRVMATLTVSGTTSIGGLLGLTGNVQQVRSNPLWIVQNTQASNANLARATKHYWYGRKADASDHMLAFMRAAHDGTGDDDLGVIDFYVNDGDDGLAASLNVLRLRASGVEAPVGLENIYDRRAEVKNGSSQVITNLAGLSSVNFDTGRHVDLGFTLGTDGNGVDYIQTDFDGLVRIGMSCQANISTGTRCSTRWEIHKDAGGTETYAVEADSRRTTYHRDTTNGDSAALPEMTFSTADGDRWAIFALVEQTVTAVTVPASRGLFWIRRAQPLAA